MNNSDSFYKFLIIHHLFTFYRQKNIFLHNKYDRRGESRLNEENKYNLAIKQLSFMNNC